ncbi:MAG: extracellular solute-binding protein [Phytoplasma sp.]|uniref:extracellular solute-binding protein n=1 Tax=Phytoplasma sp. TaxID=2155 RepID=UPI002B40AF07|nr:extracellular solute-binding protein [Phytoplasma sp.]WRH06606.1 MAG: extracellular solute-binding protein [Phytoplasma sp.]
MKNKVNLIIIIFVAILFLSFYGIVQIKKISDNKTVIVLFNWGEYIDPSLIKEYNEESKEFVVKQSFFSSNELAVNKIKAGNQYDIAILSEYAIQQLKDHYLEEIQLTDKIKQNTFTETFKKFKTKFNDQKKNDEIFSYTIPYVWGKLGFLYRKDKIKEEDLSSKKWSELIKNPKYKIALYNNAFEGIFVGLKSIDGDISVNSEKSEEEIKQAKEWLIKLKKQNNNLSFITDQILDRMKIKEKEYYDIALVYSGDARYLMQQNSNLGYYQFDDEGTNIWFDGIVLPKGSQTKGAYDFINFLLKQENRKQNNNFIGYDSPYDDIEEVKKGIEFKINDQDKIYKYNAKYKKQINDAWNEVYSYPDPKDKYLIILLLLIFILFILIYIFFNI